VATLAGKLDRASLAETLSALRDTLDSRHRPRVVAFPVERR
jgi:hypothetical protein